VTHESAAIPATAVEVVDARPPGRAGFAHGIAAGIAAAAVLVHVWLAVELASMRGMYRELGGPVPQATRLVLSRGWLLGVPIAGAFAVAMLVARRPRRLVLYVAVAAALVATAVVTNYLSTLPMRELAGNISAD
jgi:hypothetical protein